MKYTVIIRQPVAPEALSTLTTALAEHFSLTPEQAGKLAARRSGRLLKPTSRKRAELLMLVFQQAGAEVDLEEVRDDTTLLSDPFAASRPGLVGPTPAPGAEPQAADAFSAPLAGPGPLPGEAERAAALKGTEQLSSSQLTASPDWSAPLPTQEDHPVQGEISGAAPFGDPLLALEQAAPLAPTPALLPSDPLPTPAPFVQQDAELVEPLAVQTRVPELSLGGSGLRAWSSSQAGSQPADNSSGHPAGDLTGPADDAPLAPPLSDADQRPSSPPGQPFSRLPAASQPDDSWSDFTGSLLAAGPGASAGTSPADSSVASSEPGSDSGMAAPMVTQDSVPRQGRRSSLTRRLFLATLLPLVVFSGLTLGILGLVLPQAQRRLISENARAVASTVGSTIDTTNNESVSVQLDGLLASSSADFVQVELPGGQSFFRSKNTQMDTVLSSEVGRFLKARTEDALFVASSSPESAYRQQLKRLEDVGAGQSGEAETLRKTLAGTTAATSPTYQVEQITVSRLNDGTRTSGAAPAGSTPLYVVTVGVPIDEPLRQTRQTLLLIFGSALIVLLLTLMAAVRTARRLVQPIERLVKAADAISMGDLANPVVPERNDEIGDLALALERMRVSLDGAMERLRRRRAR